MSQSFFHNFFYARWFKSFVGYFGHSLLLTPPLPSRSGSHMTISCASPPPLPAKKYFLYKILCVWTIISEALTHKKNWRHFWENVGLKKIVRIFKDSAQRPKKCKKAKKKKRERFFFSPFQFRQTHVGEEEYWLSEYSSTSRQLSPPLSLFRNSHTQCLPEITSGKNTKRRLPLPPVCLFQQKRKE